MQSICDLDLYELSLEKFIQILHYSSLKHIYKKIKNYVKPHYYKELIIEFYYKINSYNNQIYYPIYLQFDDKDLSYELKWKNFINDNIKYKNMPFFIFNHNYLLCNMTSIHILTLFINNWFRFKDNTLVFEDNKKYCKVCSNKIQQIEIPKRI